MLEQWCVLKQENPAYITLHYDKSLTTYSLTSIQSIIKNQFVFRKNDAGKLPLYITNDFPYDHRESFFKFLNNELCEFNFFDFFNDSSQNIFEGNVVTVEKVNDSIHISTLKKGFQSDFDTFIINANDLYNFVMDWVMAVNKECEEIIIYQENGHFSIK